MCPGKSEYNFPDLIFLAKYATFAAIFKLSMQDGQLCSNCKDCKPVSGCDEIGRRTRLRIWRRKAWGFESLHPHSKCLKSYLNLLPLQPCFGFLIILISFRFH